MCFDLFATLCFGGEPSGSFGIEITGANAALLEHFDRRRHAADLTLTQRRNPDVKIATCQRKSHVLQTRERRHDAFLDEEVDDCRGCRQVE